ncbi:MAG: hypothetical protein AABX65_00380 [Nanoarchaeota archaeon]
MSKRPYDHTGKPHSRDWREDYVEEGRKPILDEEQPSQGYKDLSHVNDNSTLTGLEANRLFDICDD